MLGHRYTLVVLMLLIVFVAVASNWIYSYSQLANEGVEIFFVDRLDDGVTPAEHSLGGWPLKYYAVSRYSDEQQFSSFSLMRLLGNFAIWLGVLAVCWAYCYRSRKKQTETTGRNLSVSDLFVATLVIALALFYWQTLRGRTAEHRALAKRIQNENGSAGLVLELPSPLVKIMPRFFRTCFYRLSVVSLNAPTNELLEEILRLPKLSRLRIGGGDYDLRLLDDISEKPFLQQVRISGRKLDEDLMLALGRVKHLQSLNFMRTNVTSRALDGLGEMPALRHIDLTHTDVELAKTEVPGWAVHLRSIVVPHPKQGKDAELKFHGWQNLESLSCTEYDEWMNMEAVQMELHDLPKLQKLSLDALQLFDLELDNLPKLSEVEALHLQAELRVSRGQEVAGFPWIRNLSVNNVPSLSKLAIQGTHTKQICFKQAAEIDFGIGVGPHFASTRRNNTPFGTSENDTNIPLETRQSWIDGLADSDGPRRLDYSHIPLQSVNLEPLTRNKSIRFLDLSHSGADAEQLVALNSMQQLEELRVPGQVFGPEITEFVNSLPQLRRLEVDSNFVRRIKLVDHQLLRTVFGELDNPISTSFFLRTEWMRHNGLEAVHLENLPAFADTIQLLPNALFVHLENVPSLTGLVFQASLPERCTITGLRDLTVFAGGGQRLDEEIARQVVLCKDLEKLTIAHTTVSENVMRSIGELKKLEYLCLSGSVVDGNVMENLKRLRSLRCLRLDKTEASDGSLHQLSQLPLRRLWVDGFTTADLRLLPKLESLTELHLGGTDVSVDGMAEIVQMAELRELGLTRCEIDAKAMAILHSQFPPQLFVINLNDSKVDGKLLLALAYKYPYVLFDVTNTETDPSAMDFLVTQGRLATDFEDPQGEAWMIRSQIRVTQGSPPDTFGEVDPRNYDPNSKSPNLANRNLNQSLGVPLPPSSYTVPLGTIGPADSIGPQSPSIFSFEGLGYWYGRMLSSPPPQPRID